MMYAAQIVGAAEFTSRSRSLEQRVAVQNPTGPTLLAQRALEASHHVNLTVCQALSS